MTLVRLDKVSLNFGTHVLLDQVDFVLEKGDRVGLLGRNGTGKTTLLKVLAAAVQPDAGERWARPGTRIAWLEQTLPEAVAQTVYDMVADGLAETGALLKQYHQLTSHYEPARQAQLERVQSELEARGGWRLGQQVDTVISQLNLPAEAPMSSLSGGWRRRVALARALVTDPQVLLLDEPTNHLDIPAIEWLEEQLLAFPGAIVLVTHDRAFLQKIADTIVELDRGHLHRFEGSYRKFLEFRAQQLAAEEKANQLFDKKLAQEEVWIRQGIKARRTRNEGRVRALEALRRERKARRELQGPASLGLASAEASGQLVAELAEVSYRVGGIDVVRNLSLRVMRGDRIGIVGANGAGKSTLLRLLLGSLPPSAGSVKLGTRLEVAYFDQLRAALDPELNLIDNVCGGQEYIEVGGRRKHAISYLGDFLFSPERVRTPVKALSGGEQNRAILAKLFSKPANLLVLDEPTNDLDIETLELLEELLCDFDGTLLLVSHDREFMDNVVTSVLVFEGHGRIREYVGGYGDWVAKGGKLAPFDPAGAASSKGVEKPLERKSTAPAAAVARPGSSRLSYRDQRELDSLPAQIDLLESRLKDLEQLICGPDFYNRPGAQVQERLREISALQGELERSLQRWEELESRRQP